MSESSTVQHVAQHVIDPSHATPIEVPPVPFERLAEIQRRLGATDEDKTILAPYRDALLGHADAYVEFFHDYMSQSPDTRRFLDLERSPGLLRSNWRRWYVTFFREGLSKPFYHVLWASGVRHVALGVDQRNINMGYCLTRQFLERTIQQEVPLHDRPGVQAVVSRMLDMCLLTATDAFLAKTTQCDREIMNGIAHQARNPLMVIGGNVQRLIRASEDATSAAALDAIYQSARRLERMIADVGRYLDIYQRAPELDRCPLAKSLGEALRQAMMNGWPTLVRPVFEIEPGADVVLADPGMLRDLLTELLRNAAEAADPKAPTVVARSTIRNGFDESGRFVKLSFVNNGPPPAAESLASFFTPFFSSKPLGTGFGLPIARLVAQKLHGEVALKPGEKEGAVCEVVLPLAPQD